MTKKLILSIIFVIICGSCIFSFSNETSKNSNNLSKTLASIIVKKYYSITKKTITGSEKSIIIDKLNKPIRKLAHMVEYLIFSLLIILLFSNFNIKFNKIYLITILLCFIYALFDEYHQTFIDGRTGQFTDALIDTVGSLIGCLFVILGRKISN